MKKLLKMVALVTSVGAMLSFAGCGGGTPESIALKFAEKLYAEDFDGASEMCTKETAALFTMMGEMIKGSDEFKANKGGKFEVADCKINGDFATVILKCTQKSGKVVTMNGKDDIITLIKKDGNWKVNIKID